MYFKYSHVSHNPTRHSPLATLDSRVSEYAHQSFWKKAGRNKDN